MSFRTRMFGGGAALGLALAGWGLMGGHVAPADAACTPLAGPTALCTDIGPNWKSVVVGDTATGKGTGVAVVCTQEFGLDVLYGVNATAYSSMPLGKTGAEPVLCP